MRYWDERSLSHRAIPKSQLPKAQWIPAPRLFWALAPRREPSAHTQSLTLIINYGCFCFLLPQPLTAQLLAVREREREAEAESEREKGNFHRKQLVIQTSETNVP